MKMWQSFVRRPIVRRIALGGAGILIVSTVAVRPAHSQFGIDIAAILAGLNEINSTLSSDVGVIRINLGMHRDTDNARRFEAVRYECTGLERRGEWNRLLLGRRLDRTVKAEKIIVCTRSSVIGRIQFDASWHGNGIRVFAGSAFRGEQETLLLAAPGAQLQTDAGDWEVLWDGLAKR